jgi:hypothetical protein
MHEYDLAIKSLSAVLTGRDGELPNEQCPICSHSADAIAHDGDWLVCLDGSVDVVCRDCATEYDPGLVACLFPVPLAV